MRVFAISDLHTDFKENMLIIQRLSSLSYRDDVLIVAGDIADRLETIKETLSRLRSKFHRLFYVPGNHELWVRREGYDSIEKFFKILELCETLDVQTGPGKVGDAWVVPMFSWYSGNFDEDAEINDGADEGEDFDLDQLDRWADFHLCKWPEAVEASEYFFGMNEPNIKPYDGPVISFSHFLPKIALLPPKQYLLFKGLPKVAGSKLLDEQIQRLKSSIHVFGHSHINRDCTIDGVRYVQNALGYPREQEAPVFPIKIIWDSAAET